MSARVVSVNVGMPRDVAWNGRTVHTGAWKDPVSGPRLVRRLGMDGDGQGDLAGHGGPNRALLVYQTESYDYWRRHLGRDDLGPGSFAENLTVDGLPDTEVRIGDRYRIGRAEFEVSQPRVTCFRAGLRIGRPDLAALLVSHHRPGFYLRVIEEGEVAAGDEVVRTGRGRLSVADVDALLYLPEPDAELLRQAVDNPALSPGWRDSLRDLLDGRTATGPAWPGFRPLDVVDVVRETPAITSFHLADPDGAALPPARPGQYLTVRSAGAVRSYSLSGPPGRPTYRISVKRDGAVSARLHDTVHPGDRIDAAAPRGEFVLADAPGPVVLASAGVGATPVLAMLHRIVDRHPDRPLWWLHAARTPADVPFTAELAALLTRLPAARARTYLSRPTNHAPTNHDPTPPEPDNPDLTAPTVASTPDIHGTVVAGRLTAAGLADLNLWPAATAYLCGPDAFMSDVGAGLRAAGLDPAAIHTEAFGALAAINPGIVGEHPRPPHRPAGAPGTGPAVTFARSGLTTAFGDRRSVLELAEACDVPTRWVCRTGVCGTCRTGLLAGTVAYDPPPLTEPDPGTVLICCARPGTDLVLDM